MAAAAANNLPFDGNEENDVNLVVNNQAITIIPFNRDARIPQAQITFYTRLPLAQRCTLQICYVSHRKYGCVTTSKIPVIFHSHLPDGQIYYAPYRQRLSLPFRMPANGDALITGIRWNTQQARGENQVLNSCMIDGWLTDLKMRGLDRDFCFECLFQHRTGPGLLLERCLRTLILHITVSARARAARGFQKISTFSLETDLKIKRIWLDKNGIKLVPQWNEELHKEVLDLKYIPRANGKQTIF